MNIPDEPNKNICMINENNESLGAPETSEGIYTSKFEINSK